MKQSQIYQLEADMAQAFATAWNLWARVADVKGDTAGARADRAAAEQWRQHAAHSAALAEEQQKTERAAERAQEFQAVQS